MSAIVSLFRRRLAITWLGWGCCGLVLAAIPATNYITAKACLSQMRYVAMDSRDTFYISSAASFESAQHVHCELAKMAAETIFSRNPDGFDNAERLERLFNPSMAAQINKAASQDSDVFKAQSIHEKIETGIIKELEVDNSAVLVSVEGQVLRTGVFNSRVYNDAKKVVVFLRLRVNDAMASNGRYPLVVTGYETKFVE